MSKNIDNNSNNSDKKEINMETPLQARVDPYYKQKFYDILEEKTYLNRKSLMESMILAYISNERELKREENISFKNEISSIAELTNTMLSIFKSMATKSQDTINSKIDYYEQQIKNLNLNIETLNNKNNEFAETNNKLQFINDSFENEKSIMQQELESSNTKLSAKDKIINDLKVENSEYVKEIKELNKLEKENEKLIKELEKTKKENDILTESIDLVKKEAEIDAKIKISDVQSKYGEIQEKYNELQIEYLKVKEELIELKQSNKKSIILER